MTTTGELEKERACICAGCSALILEKPEEHVPERQTDVHILSMAWCICTTCTAWRAVHYPTDARELAESNAPDSELVLHCIKKWDGIPDGPDSYDRTYGELLSWNGSESCALCGRYNRDCDSHYHDDDCDSEDEMGSECDCRLACQGCPLARYLGHPCDSDGPWTEFFEGKGPESMRQALRATLAEQLEREKQENEEQHA